MGIVLNNIIELNRVLTYVIGEFGHSFHATFTGKLRTSLDVIWP